MFKNGDLALRLLQRSVASNPFHVRSWYLMATIYQHTFHNPEAAER